MLSLTSEYALRAVLYLAMHASEGPVKLEEVAGALGAPRNYLSKILHQLARAGVLTSGRGRHGGFQVAGDPRRMTLATIIEAFEPATLARRCLLGEGPCSDETACAAHALWKPVAEPMRAFFRTTTLADLLEGSAALPAAG